MPRPARIRTECPFLLPALTLFASVTHSTIQVAHLLLHGHLPNKAEYAAFMEVRIDARTSPCLFSRPPAPAYPDPFVRP